LLRNEKGDFRYHLGEAVYRSGPKAELLAKDEPKESLEHLKRAKVIAKSDPKLVIRKRQIVELGKKFL